MNYKEWNITPNVSVEGLVFGMDRSTVRKCLGKPKRVIKKTPESRNTADVYSSFHVYYSAEDHLEAVEFFGGEVRLLINSQLVFPGTLNTATAILPDLEESIGFYISKASSIGLCVEDETIESLLVGCRDYYK